MKKTLIILFLVLTCLILLNCKKVTESEYNVDTQACNSCGNCITVCPSDAIEYDSNGKALIDLSKCTQCGKCVKACPQNAIY